MSGDTASESGSSSSGKMMEETMRQDDVTTEEVLPVKMDASVPSTTNEPAPGKVVDDGGAVTGAVGGATGGAAVSNIERLLQQQRDQIMYELRRLQVGDRPVTGQGHKEAVESFFTQQQQEPDLDEHRPQTVHVEVRALAESRPVSSLLHSSRFRRSLESALRTAIGSRSPGRTSPFPSPRPSPAPRRSLIGRDQRVPSPLTRETREIPRASVRGEGGVRERTDVQATSSSSIPVPPPPPPPPSVDALRGPVDLEVRQEQQPQQPQPQEQEQQSQELNNQSSFSNAFHELQEEYPRQWLLRNVPSVSEQRDMGPWQQIEDMQREEFIYELSDLVQRQLVTQSLEGNFRNTLEHMMQERVAQAGGQGERTQQFIQSLQSSAPHRRNDFSELGIEASARAQARSLSDDVSVISATAAVTVQQSQQQVLMSREMRAMKSQLAEMKAMLKMSMDMQMETQRAIRQEVAAAIAQQGAPSAATVPQPGVHPVDDAQCLICLEATADSVLYRCGHLCVCHGCGLELKQRGHHCPVCRAPILDIIRAYKSGQS